MTPPTRPDEVPPEDSPDDPDPLEETVMVPDPPERPPEEPYDEPSPPDEIVVVYPPADPIRHQNLHALHLHCLQKRRLG